MAFPILLASAGLTVASLISGDKARQEQAKTIKIQKKIQARKDLRSKQQQLRSGAIQRAQLITAGAASGASNSSSVRGGAGSVQSQAAGNVSFINQISTMNESIYDSQEAASEYQGNAAAFGAAASLTAQLGTPSGN